MSHCDIKRQSCEGYEDERSSECEDDHEHGRHMQMWMESFHEAKQAVIVDILKAKIQKTWGAKLNQTADLIFEAMEMKIKGKYVLMSKLADIWMEKEK